MIYDVPDNAILRGAEALRRGALRPPLFGKGTALFRRKAAVFSWHFSVGTFVRPGVFFRSGCCAAAPGGRITPLIFLANY